MVIVGILVVGAHPRMKGGGCSTSEASQTINPFHPATHACRTTKSIGSWRSTVWDRTRSTVWPPNSSSTSTEWVPTLCHQYRERRRQQQQQQEQRQQHRKQACKGGKYNHYSSPLCKNAHTTGTGTGECRLCYEQATGVWVGHLEAMVAKGMSCFVLGGLRRDGWSTHPQHTQACGCQHADDAAGGQP